MPKGAEQRDHRKPCTLCSKPRNVLVRCQIDESGKWHLICPGSCWKQVSGGVIDGDKSDAHRYYVYGGMWKNKYDAVSAKKPKATKEKGEGEDGEVGVEGGEEREASAASEQEAVDRLSEHDEVGS
ncbi:hypothetical protein LTR62_003273 [Meristemomyces frigidus]|uniref:Uncharacterized protein n=1 Tax=Meristemomyces frigidus TaxID=1508187 RepID=A0AAN7YPT4_9PEZI|nr:hypothetical protein LTR62_003273 [Meristemomyces frigidus]